MSGRALVVDDELVSRLVLTTMLRQGGWTVDEADGVRAALDALERADHDVVFCDWSMPDGTGADVVAAVPRTGPDVVLVTGVLDPVGIDETIAERVSAHLSKPVGSRDLQACLAALGRGDR